MTNIVTNRLVIRDLKEVDSPFIFKLLNSPTWLEHIGDRGIKVPDDAAKYIQSQREMYTKGNLGLRLFQASSEEPLGLVGLLQREYLDAPDIGFAILPEQERQGFVTEGAQAIIENASLKTGISRFHGITSPDNLGSQRVLTKLGFEFVREIIPKSEDDLLRLYTLEITA